MKHFYEEIAPHEPWFSWPEFYKDIVDKCPDNNIIIELGCWRGKSISCLGVEVVNSRKNIHVYAIDSWEYFPETEQPCKSQEEFDIIYNEFCYNTSRFSKSWFHILRRTSEDASHLFNDKSIFCVFIDACHHYPFVKFDALTWLPKIVPGGCIAGHDYFTRVHPDVKKAVDEVFPVNLKLIPEQNVWWYSV